MMMLLNLQAVLLSICCYYFGVICAKKDMELIGVGASLPVEVYEAWAPAFENYRNEFVSLNNEYFAIGKPYPLYPVKTAITTCET